MAETAQDTRTANPEAAKYREKARPAGSSIEPVFSTNVANPTEALEARQQLGMAPGKYDKVGFPPKNVATEMEAVPKATTTTAGPAAATFSFNPDVGRINSENGITGVVPATGSPWGGVQLRPGALFEATGNFRQLMLDAGVDPSKVYSSDGTKTILGGLTISIQDPNYGFGRPIDVGLFSVSDRKIGFLVPQNVHAAVPSAYDDYNLAPSAILTVSVRKPDGTYVLRYGADYPTKISPAYENPGFDKGVDFYVQTDPKLGGTPFPNGAEISQVRAFLPNGQEVSPSSPAKPGSIVSLFFTGDRRATESMRPEGVTLSNIYGMTGSSDRSSYARIQEPLGAEVLALTEVTPGLFQLNIRMGTKPLQLTADPRNPGKTGVVIAPRLDFDGGVSFPDVTYLPFVNQ